jgi:hypothetical protein
MNEDFEWVKRCILSCTNEFQLSCIPGMIDLFNIKHDDSHAVQMLLGVLLEQGTKLGV